MQLISTLKNDVASFLSNPLKLYWVYIVLNMMPSFCLVFTEPFNVWGKVVLLLFPLGVYLTVFTLSKNTGLAQLILFPVLFLHAFQFVLFYLYGEEVISVNMYLNLVTTNPSEAGELLSAIWPSVLLVIILYIPLTIVAYKQYKKKIYFETSARRKYFATGVTLIVVSVVISYYSMNTNTDRYTFYEDVYPINTYYNLGFAVKDRVDINAYPTTSKDFSFYAQKDSLAGGREIYVLVIGETARADNWSLYGYNRSTNPNLEKESNLVYYRDAITQSNTTHKSVAVMLSSASAENFDVIYEQKGILTAFKEIGFTTVFLSNQGINNSFTEYFAQEADHYDNIKAISNDRMLNKNHHDGDLLPIMEKYIDSTHNNMFIVLHLYGSHFNYYERYPSEFAKFTPDVVKQVAKDKREELINAFDNTILYTDYVLSQAMDVLKRKGVCSALLYSSDHGEDIMDDSRQRFLHSSPNPTYYQLKIPFFIWFSDPYVASFNDKAKAAFANREQPVATNAIFHTLLDMASVRTPYMDNKLSLVDPKFEIRKRMYLTDHNTPILYYRANLKKQDIKMLEKNNMSR